MDNGQENEMALVIVKPDGIQLGVIGELTNQLYQNDYEIIECVRKKLDRQIVEEIYEDLKNGDLLDTVVDFVSSDETLVMVVEGKNAIKKIKYEIIGKYPNGLRGKYSTNMIKNVAHVSDSKKSADMEIKIMEPIFEERMTSDLCKFDNYTVFALTGLSECGKSTVGMYFDSMSIPRLKIKDYFEELRKEISPNIGLKEFSKIQENKDPFRIWDGFIDKLIKDIDRKNVKTVSIESLYGYGFANYLKYRMGDSFKLVYVDSPFELRAERQMKKEGLSSIDESRIMIEQRDVDKIQSGIPELRKKRDIYVDNSGNIENLQSQLDFIIQQYFK